MWLSAAPGGVIGGDAVCVMVPSSLRMLAFIVPFCECFHETVTVDAFGVAKWREMIILARR
jgi:hypothetical protein